MATKKVAFFINSVNDQVVIIDGNHHGLTAQDLADNHDAFWIEANPEDGIPDLCVEIDDTMDSINGDFQKEVSEEPYGLQSLNFDGPVPPKRPK